MGSNSVRVPHRTPASCAALDAADHDALAGEDAPTSGTAIGTARASGRSAVPSGRSFTGCGGSSGAALARCRHEGVSLNRCPTDETISAAEANRCLSRILRRVREEGKTFAVTAHGERVAQLLPRRSDDADRQAAREALLRRLAEQPVIDAGRWSRDEFDEC